MRVPLHGYKSLVLILALDSRIVVGQSWSPIIVRNITDLGRQATPDVTAVSRDGGYSALIDGNIVWLYDDTECMDLEGRQHSFVSNTAAYAYQRDQNITTVKDFGVVWTGEDRHGRKIHAILADTTVGSGGWIPFQPDELNFNEKRKGKERVAIWPGTSPTPISTTQAFLFAPLVYVDYKPQDPSKEYQARGMTLITINAPPSGPIATRQGDLVIPGTEVAYGGFSAIIGFPRTHGTKAPKLRKRNVYLLGMTRSGLQLARVGLHDINDFDKYTFFNPKSRSFSKTPPRPDLRDSKQVYLPGTFSSGSVFYSPYFSTFIMVYYNKMADSTFYIRYLSLEDPLDDDEVWIRGGKDGKGIGPEDAEALVKYAWSLEQKLYASPPEKGGFNYAGMAHPEYFNRQYFAKSLYPDSVSEGERRNAWYGAEMIAEEGGDSAPDGKYLLLSWTSQLRGGKDAGVYEIQLAMVEFDEIKPADGDDSTATTARNPSEPTKPPTGAQSSSTHQPDHRYDGLPEGYRGNSDCLSSFLGEVTAKRFGVWDMFWKVMIWLGIVAAGALVS